MSIEPRRLLVLRAVHRSGGVLPAARVLHLTPSAVSQHIAQLERETGLVLLDRTQRGGGRAARLTPDGVALSHRADSVATALADAERTARQLAGHHKGVVRIGGFASALTHIAARALPGLAIGEPTIVPAMVEIDDQPGYDELRGGRLDLLVSWREIVHAGDNGTAGHSLVGLVEEDLLRDEYRLVVPEAWQIDTAAELLARPWIMPPPGPSGFNAVLERLAKRAGGAALEQAHVCRDSRTMLAFVAAGLGISLVPELTLSYLPTEGTRTTTALEDLGGRIITLISRDNADEPTQAVRLHLHEHLGQ